MNQIIAALLKIIGSTNPLKDQGLALLNFSGTEEELKALEEWIAQLNLSAGKAPTGTKSVLQDLKTLRRQIEFKSAGQLAINNIKAVLSSWDEATIDLIVKKLAKKQEEPDSIKLKHATYHNRSVLNFKSFKAKAELIDDYLDTLKGFHAKALGGDLDIVFVKKELTKAGATYKRATDQIYIRPDKVANGDNYGSFIYVITHELGHRYEKLIRVKTDFDQPEWFTTKYSMKDTLSGGEQFAELFALSNWPDKYPQFKDKIDKFKGVL